jgi:PAS domain S-box-containing protein
MEATFLFEHVSDAIVRIAEDTSIEDANPSFCALLGVKKQHLLGEKFCDVLRKSALFQCNGQCSIVANQQDGNGGTAQRCPHVLHLHPILDDNRKQKGSVCIMRQIKGEREIGEAAGKSGHAPDPQETTLSMIYHDLASPLQVIKSCTDVIDMELQDVSNARFDLIRDMLGAAKRNERRLSEMVRTLRSIPQLEENAIDAMEYIRPHDVVESVCSDFRLLLKEAVTLDWDLPSILPLVVAKRELLERVFFNLLDNAARYTRPEGRILVSARHEAGDTHMTFSVFDDGEAISRNLQALFFQKDAGGSMERKTLARRDHGLGLYFCQLTIERFGGRIWVESKEGWGVQFSFTLPIVVSAMSFARDWIARSREP